MNAPAHLDQRQRPHCLAGGVTPPAFERIISMPPRGPHNNMLEESR